jgi:hypothetical protein
MFVPWQTDKGNLGVPPATPEAPYHNLADFGRHIAASIAAQPDATSLWSARLPLVTLFTQSCSKSWSERSSSTSWMQAWTEWEWSCLSATRI